MSDQQTDYSQPVAYDANGRPLYAHPPADVPTTPPPVTFEASQPQPQQHVPQPTPVVDPEPVAASDEVLARHLKSRSTYPTLNLSEGEHVIKEIRRHPIGLVPIIGAASLVFVAGLVLLLLYPMIEKSAAPGAFPPFSSIVLPVAMVIIFIALIAYAAATIYNANRFFLTNESVIEEIQNSLFARKEKTVGLHSIEEVTFRQDNIFQNMFDYGTVLMTIEGHTIYTFQYVGNPKALVDLLVNTIEDSKRGGHGHH